MSAERLSMRKLREILRLRYEGKIPVRGIATSCRASPSTVIRYLERAEVAKLGWPLPEEMNDEALEKLLFPKEKKPEKERPEPAYGEIHIELRRKHVTLQLLWEEYQEQHPEGYQYSQFCKLYQRWASKLNPTMRQTHRVGEKTFVDFSGDGLTLIDPATGECRKAPLFLAVLGASNYTYVEPVEREDLPTWLGCHVRTFEFYEGVSEIVVPDNLKAGVTTPHYYEPDINLAYADLANHYGVAVIPARVRKPRDKAKVEQAVLLAERWILACLRKRQFFSIEEARKAVRELVEKLNNRPMRRLKKSRKELFDEIERAALKPLPSKPYELSQWARPRVNIDYHVEFECNFYSVPYGLIHEVLDLRATESVVEIFSKSQRITSHQRCYGKNIAITNPEHMPSSHRAYAKWTPERITEWMKKIGPNTATVGEEIMKRRSHPIKAYRSCLGIIRLGERFGLERLERACARAVRFCAFSYKNIEAILKNNLDRSKDEIALDQACLPPHDNVRGGDYYH